MTDIARKPTKGTNIKFQMYSKITKVGEDLYELDFDYPDGLNPAFEERTKAEYVIRILNEKNDELTAKLDKLKRQNSEVFAENARIAEQCSKDQKELKKLRAANLELNRKLQDKDTANRKLQTRIDSLNEADKENNKAMCEMADKIEYLELYIKELKRLKNG